VIASVTDFFPMDDQDRGTHDGTIPGAVGLCINDG
jgi:hypothetical protein